MALAGSLAAWLGALLFAVAAAAAGRRILRAFRWAVFSGTEHILCSIAAGVLAIQVGWFLAQVLGLARWGVLTVLVAAAIAGARDFGPVIRTLADAWRSLGAGPSRDRVLAVVAGLVLLFEGFAALAPLTGSDALHYHFTAELLTLRDGFRPNFFLSHSFFCGQSHLLIFAGLALGSEKLALALLSLGGLLTAAATACLARRWMPSEWSWLVVLALLFTPVVFWQMSTAGTPDLWMAFFAVLGVLVVAQTPQNPGPAHAAVAGALAGGVAGAKYTGCIVAASLLVAFLREARSPRGTGLFVLSALGAGAWPYLRNVVWTRDPFFPFLLRWISPQNLNSHALALYLADTGASARHGAWTILKFPFFAAIDPAHLGFWQFLGPLVLAFAPLLLLAVRNTPSWRVGLTVWLLSAVLIGATSGMTRFLLPVFPIALAAVLAGAAALKEVGWRAARVFALATICAYALGGAAGLAVYGRSGLSAALGMMSREEYLRQRAPDYATADFLNRALAGHEAEGKTLVFFRHVYYLKVPFVYGSPEASWAVDPQRFETPEAWLALFRKEGIRWVLRTPSYPLPIARPLGQLEAQGSLVPVAESEVRELAGLRINEQRKPFRLVLLRVAN